MQPDEIVDLLRSLASHNPDDLKGMQRYGINISRTLGVISTPNMMKLARGLGKDHALALQLWEKGFRETRILAALTDDPAQVTLDQMENWVTDFDSWDVCDGICLHLFSKSKLAPAKAVEWSSRDEEFAKRAAFTLIACLAVGKRGITDEQLAAFLPIVEREATDERNYVKKAVNWALRQIGKRDIRLNRLAIDACRRIQRLDSKSARWIAADALRELTGEKVITRLSRKKA
jgi:3-methyladenine DNA glycosylase AlkD